MLFFIVAAFSIHCKPVFFGSFFLGFTCIFASNPTWTLVILNAAPPMVRPMALGVATIFYHLCGDVPAPVIVGHVLDAFLKRAGQDEKKRWFAYLYTHWFSLSISVLMVLACLLTALFAKRRLDKEIRDSCCIVFYHKHQNKTENQLIAPLP